VVVQEDGACLLVGWVDARRVCHACAGHVLYMRIRVKKLEKSEVLSSGI
jgi:hypothetical protein